MPMLNNIEIWLERLSSLYISQMRQAASEQGFQLVNLEILQYLSICNDYSNTAQAISEYLGQTKGSISQTLKIMEQSGHIERRPCTKDKRVIRLFLTEKGQNSLQKMSQHMVQIPDENPEVLAGIKQLLKTWQHNHHNTGFGQCLSCKYHQTAGGQKFKCELTGEYLPLPDKFKICREHEFENQTE
ncbi:MAG: MarR family transcriptional regulator [Proteobacteria bacterium]|nr:MAG: MarR family transcriptional regulator [Pseudomonadota bacterium]